MRTLIPASGQLLKGLVRYYTLCRCHKSDQFMSGMLDQHHHTYTVCKKWSLYSLPSRGLVGLRGIDVIPFLQGLITNDVSKLGNLGSSSKSMYAMMLNVQGRVMYDILIHNSQSDTIPSVILEVDRSVVQDVIKTLKKYKIRKKVDIYDVSGERQVFATVALEIPDSNVSWLPLNGTDIIANPDPRLEKFGWRIVAPDETYIRSNLDSDVSLVLGDEVEYHIARYKLGIPEGTEDLPPGDCLPLESNIVYHNGVSFTKGCYIGQELTARTHHTGVTRKRIIPLQFDIAPVNIVPGSSILTASGKSAGKFRSARDVYGLGLVRLSYIKDILKVTSQGGDIYTTRTVIPTWWPQDIAANKL